MGHTTHTITHMYRGKSTTKESTLHKIQSILHVKILFYNFNPHSTGFTNYNTGKKKKKLTMFSPSKCGFSSSKVRPPQKIVCLTQKKPKYSLKCVFPNEKL